MDLGQMRLKTCDMGGVVFHMLLSYSAHIARKFVAFVRTSYF